MKKATKVITKSIQVGAISKHIAFILGDDNIWYIAAKDLDYKKHQRQDKRYTNTFFNMKSRKTWYGDIQPQNVITINPETIKPIPSHWPENIKETSPILNAKTVINYCKKRNHRKEKRDLGRALEEKLQNLIKQYPKTTDKPIKTKLMEKIKKEYETKESITIQKLKEENEILKKAMKIILKEENIK